MEFKERLLPSVENVPLYLQNNTVSLPLEQFKYIPCIRFKYELLDVFAFTWTQYY